MKPKPTFSFLTGSLLAVAATGIALESTPAIAQEAAEEIGEIVVKAPAVVTKRVARVDRTFRKVYEADRFIDLSDLDLSLYKDVMELEVRIENVAMEVCRQLADLKPRLQEPEPKCIRDAIASTKKQLQKAVSAAS